MPCKRRHIKFNSIQALEFFKFQTKLWKTCSVSKSKVGAQVGSILLLILLRYPTKGVEMWFSRPQQRTTTLSGKAYGMEEDALGGGGGGAISGSLKIKLWRGC